MLKLEKLVIGNAEATTLQSGNEVTTTQADATNPVNARFTVS
jgi:hypothetical protein